MSDENESVETLENDVIETESNEDVGEVSISEENESESGTLDNGEEQIEVTAKTEKELESEIKDAIKEGASDEQVKDMIRQYTLKVNGREFQAELDLNDDDAVKKHLQLAYAGRQAMQENAEIKKLYSGELQEILRDPLKRLAALDPNFDPLEISARYLDEYLKQQEMSPEERERIAYENKVRAIMEENERLRKAVIQREQQEQIERLEAEFRNDIMTAIQSDPELELDEDTVALVAQNLLHLEEAGYQARAKDVLPNVKKQIREQFRKAASKFKSVPVLKEYMGNDLLEKLREDRIELAKKQQQIKSVNNITDTKKTEEIKTKDIERIPLSSLFK